MQLIYTTYPPEDKQFTELRDFLRPHFLELRTIDELKGSIATKEIQNYLREHEIGSNTLISDLNQLTVINQTEVREIFDKRGLAFCISKYILSYHTYTPSQLTVRSEELNLIEEYVKDGSPNFSKSPEQWIRGNPFYAILKPKPFYDRLLTHTLDKKGLFIKAWTLRAQHNYFHPSVNSGLPLTKKKDAIHEGTFMMHDMFHHVFKDAIASGHENEEEKAVYIACRMMSEACTLVLADMIAIAHSGVEGAKYDITKRQIYPLFQSLKLDPFDIETVRKALYANCVYCLYGDTSVYKALGASEEALNLYTSKYYKFFSGDFAWNEKNINRMIDRTQASTGLKKYFKSLDPSFSEFSTHALAKRIKRANGNLSFNALFEIFWQQLVSVIHYQDFSNHLQYQKTCYIKYISGQMQLVFIHNRRKSAKDLIARYPQVMSGIKRAKTSQRVETLGSQFVQDINHFIDELTKKNLLTEVESVVNKLHVPLFPPEYVNYDENDKDFEQLEAISARILRPYFPQEDFTYKPLPKKLKDYYYKIVST